MLLDADNVYYRELNKQIRELVAKGEKEFEIINVRGQRYIADGLEGDLKFLVRGVPGQDQPPLGAQGLRATLVSERFTCSLPFLPGQAPVAQAAGVAASVPPRPSFFPAPHAPVASPLPAS